MITSAGIHNRHAPLSHRCWAPRVRVPGLGTSCLLVMLVVRPCPAASGGRSHVPPDPVSAVDWESHGP
jgi:hypothetical protein